MHTVQDVGDKELKNIVKNRLIGTVVSVLVFLVGFYVKSFASVKDLKRLEQSHNSDIQEVRNTHMKQVDAVAAKFDKILTGLCIIDKRTCKLSK